MSTQTATLQVNPAVVNHLFSNFSEKLQELLGDIKVGLKNAGYDDDKASSLLDKAVSFIDEGKYDDALQVIVDFQPHAVKYNLSLSPHYSNIMLISKLDDLITRLVNLGVYEDMSYTEYT